MKQGLVVFPIEAVADVEETGGDGAMGEKDGGGRKERISRRVDTRDASVTVIAERTLKRCLAADRHADFGPSR